MLTANYDSSDLQQAAVRPKPSTKLLYGSGAPRMQLHLGSSCLQLRSCLQHLLSKQHLL
jgi:hypothetical protein